MAAGVMETGDPASSSMRPGIRRNKVRRAWDSKPFRNEAEVLSDV